jgi:hypothetical protein
MKKLIVLALGALDAPPPAGPRSSAELEEAASAGLLSF